MSFLKAVGKVPVAVFHWITSAKGQAVIAAGEGVAVTIFPQITGVVNLINAWMQKIVVTETIAEAAGKGDGTGLAKATAVLEAIGPEVYKYFPEMTAAEIADANTHLVAFLNALKLSQTPVAAGK